MLIHINIIFQLEREQTRHQSEVSELMDMASKWMDRWYEKRQKLKGLKKENLNLSMDLGELNKIKFQLIESLLENLLAERPITLVLMMINSCSYSTNDLVFI